jgi:RNA-directed DNA polymerase
VRYADDFVVLCPTQEDALKARELLTVWLAERGLSFSEDKTRIVHLTEGFNFLGWNIRHYKVTDRTSGYKLLIKPSKESVKAIRGKLREIWTAHRGKPVDVVIRKLNPVIRGWAAYHRGVVASDVFKKLDHWMYKRAKSHVRFGSWQLLVIRRHTTPVAAKDRASPGQTWFV